jgi:hypothetical protein
MVDSIIAYLSAYVNFSILVSEIISCPKLVHIGISIRSAIWDTREDEIGIFGADLGPKSSFSEVSVRDL